MPRRDREVWPLNSGGDCENGDVAAGDRRGSACQQRAFQAGCIRDGRLQSRVMPGVQQAVEVLQRVHLQLLLHAKQQQRENEDDERAVPEGDQVV